MGYNFYGTDEAEVDFKDPTSVGFIYELRGSSFLMAEGLATEEFRAVSDLKGEAVVFNRTENTRVFDKDGERILFSDLMLGDEVEVWAEGPLAESHPMQGEIDKIRIISRYNEYESDKFRLTLQIPDGSTTNYENDRLKVTFVGPDSQMAEITDGFTFFVDLLDGDLEFVSKKIFNEQTEALEPVSELQEEELFGLEGYGFEVIGGLGNKVKHFMYEEEGKIVNISYSIIDPNEAGYIEKIEEIVQSINIKEDTSASAECTVSGCSGEICSLDSPVETTCEALPGAECLNEASCEFVEDDCQWVLNEEAARCFMEVEEEFGSRARDSRIGYLFGRAEEALN